MEMLIDAEEEKPPSTEEKKLLKAYSQLTLELSKVSNKNREEDTYSSLGSVLCGDFYVLPGPFSGISFWSKSHRNFLSSNFPFFISRDSSVHSLSGTSGEVA